VPLIYDGPLHDGPLRQGEILAGVSEYRVLPNPPGGYLVGEIAHPLVVALSADCDLVQEHVARLTLGSPPGEVQPEQEADGRIVPHVIVCDLFNEETVRGRPGLNSDLFRRIRRNQDERYHTLPDPRSAQTPPDARPQLFIDFRKALSIPTTSLYLAIEQKMIQRISVVPHTYVHDLIQRFFAFHSRVGTPD